MVALVVQIEIFGLTTGEILHHHAPPLSLALALPPALRPLCATNPERIAILHADASGQVVRLAPASFDCANYAVNVTLYQTSSIAVVQMPTALTIPFHLSVPVAPDRSPFG
jgi:hypothetical protein